LVTTGSIGAEDLVKEHAIDYPTPSGINYLWSFGVLSLICLVVQILTGVFLAMHYTTNIEYAFNSIEHIMRDVSNGWLLRYLHANGASFFFFVVYSHLFRGIYFGSFVERIVLWTLGIVIFLAMMATAFMGYVLPWGQMSFWGATVITNLFSAIPLVGPTVVEWLWGGFSVDNATLNRFFSLHYLLPFLITALVIAHLGVLHSQGSTTPINIDKRLNVISFFPYFYVKDLLAIFVFLCVYFIFISYYPNVLGHSDNYIVANSLVTPAHIVPEWYFLPFYAILRSVPDKLLGVIAMFLAIVILVLLPFFHYSNTRNIKYRLLYNYFYWVIAFNFIFLGWIGQKPVESPFMEIGFFTTVFYFYCLSYFTFVIGYGEEYLLNYTFHKSDE
jgi:quinol-cytochrome oxidoreductase complex cytochrome b subunit